MNKRLVQIVFDVCVVTVIDDYRQNPLPTVPEIVGRNKIIRRVGTWAATTGSRQIHGHVNVTWVRIGGVPTLDRYPSIGIIYGVATLAEML